MINAYITTVVTFILWNIFSGKLCWIAILSFNAFHGFIDYIFLFLEITAYKVEVENLKNEHENLESENVELKSEVDSYQEKIKELNEKFVSAVDKLNSIQETSRKSVEIEKGIFFILYLCVQ